MLKYDGSPPKWTGDTDQTYSISQGRVGVVVVG